MTVQQIPNMTPAIAIDGTEQIELVQAGSTVRGTTGQIAALASFNPISPNITGGTITGSAILGGTMTGTAVSGGTVSGATLFNVDLGTPTAGVLTNATGLPISTGLTGIGSGVAALLGSTATGTGSLVGSVSPVFTTPNLGTPSVLNLTNATGLPLSTGVTGVLAVSQGGTSTTTSTGTGSVVLSSSPTLVTPALGIPSSATLTNATGLPIDAGTTGTLPVSRGGTSATSATGTGSLVLSNSPTLVTPALGTPSEVVLTNGTGLPIGTGVTGLGVGILSPLESSPTGSGAMVLATGAVLTSPNLGTPSAAILTNATGVPIATGVDGLGAGIAAQLAAPTTGTGVLVATASPTITSPALPGGFTFPTPADATSSNTALRRQVQAQYATVAALLLNATAYATGILVEVPGIGLYSRQATSGAGAIGPDAGGNYWSVSPNIIIHAEQFGFSATATGADNLTALEAARDYLSTLSGGVLKVSTAATIEGDFNLAWGIGFDAEGVSLTFNNGGLLVSGVVAAQALAYWYIKADITRTGTAGPAIWFQGDDSVTPQYGAIRGRAYVRVRGSTGGGIKLTDAYIIDFFSPQIYNCTDGGWEMGLGPASVTGVNDVKIFGGETQNCGSIGTFTQCRGIHWYGHDFEGNAAGGTLTNCYAWNMFGGYQELDGTAAGTYDWTVGVSADTSCYNVQFNGIEFYNGSGALKTHAINLVKVYNVSVENCVSHSYATAMVAFNPGALGYVRGVHYNNTAFSSTPGVIVPTTDAAPNKYFRPISVRNAALTGTVVWDIPSLSAGGTQSTTTLTVTGASVGDFAQVTYQGGYADVYVQAKVTAADTVTLTATNWNTTTARDQGTITYYVLVEPRSYYF